jgi:hypothetical protein
MISLFNSPKPQNHDSTIDYIERSEEDRIREYRAACETVKSVERAIAQIVSDSSIKSDIVGLIQANWHDPIVLKTEIALRLETYTEFIDGFADFHTDAQLYTLHEAKRQLLSKFTVEVKTID